MLGKVKCSNGQILQNTYSDHLLTPSVQIQVTGVLGDYSYRVEGFYHGYSEVTGGNRNCLHIQRPTHVCGSVTLEYNTTPLDHG